MGQVFICGDGGPLVAPDRDCPNAANHQPHPTGYIAHSAWAEAASHVALQKPCPGCKLWHIWTPRRPDLRIARVWPVPVCGMDGCRGEGVGERRVAEGVWVPVCAGHAKAFS